MAWLALVARTDAKLATCSRGFHAAWAEPLQWVEHPWNCCSPNFYSSSHGATCPSWQAMRIAVGVARTDHAVVAAALAPGRPVAGAEATAQAVAFASAVEAAVAAPAVALAVAPKSAPFGPGAASGRTFGRESGRMRKEPVADDDGGARIAAAAAAAHKPAAAATIMLPGGGGVSGCAAVAADTDASVLHVQDAALSLSRRRVSLAPSHLP
mmetsp:Transcript_30894/g.80701  ORF Transcript_30894/g.80701 Transcript_30894/m.80701 type:complete len:211 (+) Transcript_30894:2201-2833(+)